MSENTNTTKDNLFLSYGQWQERFLNREYEEAKNRLMDQDVSKISEVLANKAVNHVMQLKH